MKIPPSMLSEQALRGIALEFVSREGTDYGHKDWDMETKVEQVLGQIARGTPGFSGADLENLVNEAALLAARKNKERVEISDFEDAKDKVLMGTERRSMVMTDEEKPLTAYHEAGHALICILTPEDSDPVHKVTIIPRGQALGVTWTHPVEDRFNLTKTQIYARIRHAMGGRAAEEIIFGHFSTGASNDLQRVTSIARGMVAEYGMSEVIGQVQHTSRNENSFLGDALSQRPYSDETALLIDKEVRQMVEEIYAMTLFILETNVDLLHEMSDLLKKDEVLDGEPLQAMLDRVLAIDKENVPERDGTP